MTRTDALQAVLAGEHAAVYAFGVVGGRLQGSPDESDAKAAYSRHLARRDRVTAELLAAGATPVSSAAAYALGGPVTTPSAARALAATVELGLCGPYADLVAVAEKDERETAADWCADAAVRSVGWGGDPVAFPGLAERT